MAQYYCLFVPAFGLVPTASTPVRRVMSEMRPCLWVIHTYQSGDGRDASVYELSTSISRVMLSEMRLCLWAIHTYQSGDVRDAPLFMSYSHLSVGWCQRCASVYKLFTPISPVMSEMRLCLWATCIHTYQFGDVSDASLFMSYLHLSVWWFQR